MLDDVSTDVGGRSVPFAKFATYEVSEVCSVRGDGTDVPFIESGVPNGWRVDEQLLAPPVPMSSGQVSTRLFVGQLFLVDTPNPFIWRHLLRNHLIRE